MKNIHVLPTDKPSRLLKSQDNNFILLNTNAPNWFEINLKTTKQNICITSDEEIKEEDYFVYKSNNFLFVDKPSKDTLEIINKEKNTYKKIILTTDVDLIKDGVQPIPDEFLEWFVKNPSCESIETDSYKTIYHTWLYKIVIPKEEPNWKELENSGLDKPFQLNKQETPEEAASKLLYNKYPYHSPQDSGYWKDMFIEGAKWQKERMYSEDEVMNILEERDLHNSINMGGNNTWIDRPEWFKKFRKQ